MYTKFGCLWTLKIFQILTSCLTKIKSNIFVSLKIMQERLCAKIANQFMGEFFLYKTFRQIRQNPETVKFENFKYFYLH